ncbi:MBL fold metallo-hydrolase [Streptomyces sp. N2-109]|uniref:MBL fold metallo-hydrolase n=1 Tax=Streptomyces gossypii TaxID=2883101 RepID=A0ABT2JR69_9ACTN|nr:MBL fold metallo-hydrolase [Streptomyces gossypii]MCT2590385.1 MBL fold metallo-hydrolase [Streptomyces gossypii]
MDAGWEDTGWEDITSGVARRRLPRWDATTGAIAGPDGVLVVDTGATLREGAGIRRAVQARFGRPVTHVALTHGHFDHVLGTAAFAGVRVYGAEGLEVLLAARSPGREALRASAVQHGVSLREAAEAADVVVAPRQAVTGELTVSLGGDRQVLLAGLGPAHSEHDLAVLVPGSGPGDPAVVFCGDLVEESGRPQAGPDTHPARWPAALDRLLELGGEDARYVPGHGATVDAAFVRRQRDELALRFRSA